MTEPMGNTLPKENAIPTLYYINPQLRFSANLAGYGDGPVLLLQRSTKDAGFWVTIAVLSIPATLKIISTRSDILAELEDWIHQMQESQPLAPNEHAVSGNLRKLEAYIATLRLQYPEDTREFQMNITLGWEWR